MKTYLLQYFHFYNHDLYIEEQYRQINLIWGSFVHLHIEL